MADDDPSYERDLADVLSDADELDVVGATPPAVPPSRTRLDPLDEPDDDPASSIDPAAAWSDLSARPAKRDSESNGAGAASQGATEARSDSASLDASDLDSDLSDSPLRGRFPGPEHEHDTQDLGDEEYSAELKSVLGSEADGLDDRSSLSSDQEQSCPPPLAPTSEPDRSDHDSGSPSSPFLSAGQLQGTAQRSPPPSSPPDPTATTLPAQSNRISRDSDDEVEATPNASESNPTGAEGNQARAPSTDPVSSAPEPDAPTFPTSPPAESEASKVAPVPDQHHSSNSSTPATLPTIKPSAQPTSFAQAQAPPSDSKPTWVATLDQQFAQSHARGTQLRADLQRPREFPALSRLRAPPGSESSAQDSSVASISAFSRSPSAGRGRDRSRAPSVSSRDGPPELLRSRHRSASVSTLGTIAPPPTQQFYPWGASEPSNRRDSISSILSFAPAQTGLATVPLDVAVRDGQQQSTVDEHAFDGQGVPLTQGAGAHLLALEQQELFHWTTMRQVSSAVVPFTPGRTVAETEVMPEQEYEARSETGEFNPDAMPDGTSRAQATCLVTSHGLVAVGLSSGTTLVFTYGQQLHATLTLTANKVAMDPPGEVSALAFSHDGTYVGVGHATGHILLWDLSKTKQPARLVSPPPLAAVRAGRREGHLPGSRIVRLNFVGARHTAIVSADSTGLAFYHSLGKILGVSSNDTLRIFGRYVSAPSIPEGIAESHREAKTTILDLAALPLGSTSHLSDGHLFIAIAAPDKVVLCAIKPVARTWWRRRAPTVPTIHTSQPQTTSADATPIDPVPSSPQPVLAAALAWRPAASGKRPTLACTLGTELMLLELSTASIRATDTPPHAPPTEHVELVEHEPVALPDAPLTIRWLDSDLLFLLGQSTYMLFDAKVWALVHSAPRPHPLTDILAHSWLPPITLPRDPSHTRYRPLPSIGSSLAVAGQRVFVLTHRHVVVGTLLSWADHLLALVSQGNFISAIRLATAYYLGVHPFFSYGLPRNVNERTKLVGGRLVELMRASATYAFSEDRFRDSTHISTDGRGVDRTEFFELLARTCAEASLDVGDVQFLWFDLYEKYTSAGIEGLFVTQMESFILAGRMANLLPEVVQRLLTFHITRQEYDQAAQLVWHVEVGCLDLDQVLGVCRYHGLYDALTYVLNQGLNDFVAPLIELGDLIRRVLVFEADEQGEEERRLANAYKVYSYLSVILVGRQYPSQKPLEEPISTLAKEQVYRTLFAKEDSHWAEQHCAEQPPAMFSNSDMILPSWNMAYPLLHLLLALDAEALLDVFDLALEDSYLDETDTAVFTRQQIVDVLLEIAAGAGQSSNPGGQVSATTGVLIDIFVARNTPKYPQFISLSPDAIRTTLERLALHDGETTLVDRELAAESLLANTVAGGIQSLIPLFETAGFTRILARCYRRAKVWNKLLNLVIGQAEADQAAARMPSGSVSAALLSGAEEQDPATTFTEIRFIFVQCTRTDPARVALEQQLASSAASLVVMDVAQTALLMNDVATDQQSTVLDALLSRAPETAQLAYLACYFPWTDPGTVSTVVKRDQDLSAIEVAGAAQAASTAAAAIEASGVALSADKLPPDAANLYISLVSGLVPGALLDVLQAAAPGTFDLDHVVSVAEEDQVYNALVWASNVVHGPDGALDTLDKIVSEVGQSVAAAVALQAHEGECTLRDAIEALRSSFAGSVGIVTTAEELQNHGSDMPHRWIRIVASLTSLNHMVALAQRSMGRKNSPSAAAAAELTEEMIATILASPAGQQISFPVLVRALLGEDEDASHAEAQEESSAHAVQSSNHRARYAADIRPVIQALAKAYRTRADELDMARKAVQRDEAEAFDALVRARRSGWRPAQSPSNAPCVRCGLPVFYASAQTDLDVGISRSPSPNGAWTPPYQPGTGTSTPRHGSLLDVPCSGLPHGTPSDMVRRPSIVTARGSVLSLPKRNSAPYLEGLPSPALDKGKAPVRDKPSSNGTDLNRSMSGSSQPAEVTDYFTLPARTESPHSMNNDYDRPMMTSSSGMTGLSANPPPLPPPMISVNGQAHRSRTPATAPVLLARSGQAWHLACAPPSLVPRDPPVLLRSNSLMGTTV